MMTTRTCKAHSTRILSNGQVKTYEFNKTYTVNNAYVVPDDKLVEIIKLHKLGVPATRIAPEVGYTAERVRRIIKRAANQAGKAAPIEAKKED